MDRGWGLATALVAQPECHFSAACAGRRRPTGIAQNDILRRGRTTERDVGDGQLDMLSAPDRCSCGLSRAWMTFDGLFSVGLANEDGAGLGRLLGGGQDRDGPLVAEGKLLGGHMASRLEWGRGRPTNR